VRLPLFSLICLGVLAASDWTRFRGPNGAGVSPDRGLPTEIDRDRNVLWKIKTPKGNSSPIVTEGRLCITGYEGDERIVLCYDAGTGAPLWRRSVTRAFAEIANPENGYTTPTPATDGKFLFVFLSDFGLISYSLDGKERWRVPLGPFGGVQGMAESPVYVEGLIVLPVDTPEQAYLAAFDAETGKLVWKKERPIGFLGAYTTPAVYKPADGPTQIVVAGAVELTGYQARTGERLWWVRGVTNAPAAPPLIVGDAVYTLEPTGNGAPPFKQMLEQFDKNKDGKIALSEITGDGINDNIMRRIFKSVDKHVGNGNGVVTEEEWTAAFQLSRADGGLVRTRLGGKGDVTATNVVWRYMKGLPYVTAPLLYNGILYVIRDGGILTTINPETGEQLRQDRLKDAIGQYYASPVAGDGKIYFVSLDGKVSVVRAGADWEKTSSGDLEERVVATPAIAGSRIYVRTESALYCFAAPQQGK
jgi:outer membrane protein assembly factor BamB